MRTLGDIGYRHRLLDELARRSVQPQRAAMEAGHARPYGDNRTIAQVLPRRQQSPHCSAKRHTCLEANQYALGIFIPMLPSLDSC